MPDFTGTNASEILNGSETADKVMVLGGTDLVDALGGDDTEPIRCSAAPATTSSTATVSPTKAHPATRSISGMSSTTRGMAAAIRSAMVC